MVDHHICQWRNSQMVAALWRYTVTTPRHGGNPGDWAAKVPGTFASRIKKLKNLDRMPSMAPALKMPEDQWAFYDKPGKGAGSEELFSTFHVFLMGLALDLLDIGLKQAEIIFALKHMRSPFLDTVFDAIHQKTDQLAPIAGKARTPKFHAQYPQSQPMFRSGRDKAPAADFSHWMIIRRIENVEKYPGWRHMRRPTEGIPLIMHPEFFEGLEALKASLYERMIINRCAIIIELADLALMIPRYLMEAPRIGRGRPISEV